MKITSSLILLIITLSICSCKNNDLKNPKTEDLIHIPGSKVSFPKSSFSLSDQIVGLTKDDKALILITEMPNEDFQKSLKGQTGFFESRNPGILLEKKDLKIENYNGVLWICEEPNNTKIHTLLFGDSSFTTVITARHDLEDQVSEQEIKFLFANISYNDKMVLNPLDRAPYYIDGNYDGFKNYRNSQNTHFYSKEGENSKTHKSLVIFHGMLGINNDFESEYAGIWSKKIQNNGAESYDLNKDKTIINGYNAYESVFDLDNNGKNEKEYLLFMQNGRKYIGVSAIAIKDLDSTIADFKKFAHQLKFKK